jgi:hypothetical protein
MARTHWPTRRASESPISAASNGSSGTIRSTPMSVCLSVPITVAGYFGFRPGMVTVTFSAFITTCSLVRMKPSLETTNPEPVTCLRRLLCSEMASM